MNKLIPIASPSLSKLERDRMIQAFDSSWIGSSGEFLTEFESNFADLCGTKHALAVSNGTTALHLALAALDIGPGDEVVVPSLTYVATANAVRYTGAEPVFADVSRRDWGLDTKSVEQCIGSRTRAVIAVHLYGHPADMTALRELCNAADVFLVEDAAEAPFAVRDGLRTGGMGKVATFSFYGNKVITSGEGGAVTTNDGELFERMRLLRGQGMDTNRRYWFPVVGYNFRLTNLQAALLCGQLEQLSQILAARHEIFTRYDEAFSDCPGVVRQPCVPGTATTPWLYSLLLEDEITRDSLMHVLSRQDIETRPFFIPLHTMPPYVHSHTAPEMTVTVELSRRGVNLPTYPGLSPGDQNRITQVILDFFR